MAGLLVKLVVLSLSCAVVFGCSCFPQHPQSQFCGSKFVMYGEVVSERVIPGPPDDFAGNMVVRKYRVQILHKMKGIGGRINGYTTVQSEGNSAMCGMSLSVGQKYIMMGYKSGRNKYINSCSFVRTPSSLTFDQIFYLFTKGPYSYFQNCKKGCTNVDPGSDSCPVPMHATECLSRNAVCAVSGGVCSWINHESCHITTTPPPTKRVTMILP